ILAALQGQFDAAVLDLVRISFPSSAWEREAPKLCFAGTVSHQKIRFWVGCRCDEAELRGRAFPSRAWERELQRELQKRKEPKRRRDDRRTPKRGKVFARLQVAALSCRDVPCSALPARPPSPTEANDPDDSPHPARDRPGPRLPRDVCSLSGGSRGE